MMHTMHSQTNAQPHAPTKMHAWYVLRIQIFRERGRGERGGEREGERERERGREGERWREKAHSQTTNSPVL